MSRSEHYDGLVDWVIAYEDDRLTEQEVIEGFQRLIDTGIAWKWQGSYGRTARALIDAGICTEAQS